MGTAKNLNFAARNDINSANRKKFQVFEFFISYSSFEVLGTKSARPRFRRHPLLPHLDFVDDFIHTKDIPGILLGHLSLSLAGHKTVESDYAFFRSH